MVDTFEIVTSYHVKYTNKDPLPISDIVDSLLSFEKLIKRTPVFIEKAYEGIQVVDVEVFTVALESGSLIQDFIIKYIVKGQDNYNQAKDVIDKIIQDNAAVKTVLAVGVGAVLMYGVSSALPKNSPQSNITAYNNVIISAGRDVNLTKENIEDALKGISDKKALAKEAVAAVAPAKKDTAASIEFAGFNALEVRPAFVAEVPDEYTPPVPDEKIEKYSNTMIFIHASDRDKTTQGWAGSVPGIVDKRVKFVLDEEVDPKKLHGRTNLKADISITSRYVKSKKRMKQNK